MAFSLLGRGGLKNDNIFPLMDKAIGFGTSPDDCAIIYPANSRGISPFHCQLVPHEGGWVLTDFSEAGTWLNGTKLEKFRAYPLKAGDVFYLASLENSFCLQSDETTSTQPQSINPPTINPPPSRTNPPPITQPEESFKDKFFSWQGRLNRKPYILRWLVIFVVQTVVIQIFSAFFDNTGELVTPDMSKEEIANVYIDIIPIFFLVTLPMTVSFYTLMIRRLHDLNKSGKWTGIFVAMSVWSYYTIYKLFNYAVDPSLADERTMIGLLVILTGVLLLVCFVFAMYLFCKRGTKGANRFGSDPLESR